MKLRIATIEDLPATVEIYNQAIAVGQRTADTEPVTVESRQDWFAAHPADKYPLIIAEDEQGNMMGYLTLSAYRPGRLALRYTAEISYYIHFDYHRQGVGSALFQYAIDLCPSLQLKSLVAILMDCNQGSIGILEKFGFQRWGHLPGIADYDGIEVGQYYYGLRVYD